MLQEGVIIFYIIVAIVLICAGYLCKKSNEEEEAREFINLDAPTPLPLAVVIQQPAAGEDIDESEVSFAIPAD